MVAKYSFVSVVFMDNLLQRNVLAMAKLDQETIQLLSTLCRIECTEEEEMGLLKDLQKILAYFETLDEIDTTDVPPCYQVHENVSNNFRDDEVGDTLPRDVFLSNAPSHTGGMIKVPTVIKGR